MEYREPDLGSFILNTGFSRRSAIDLTTLIALSRRRIRLESFTNVLQSESVVSENALRGELHGVWGSSFVSVNLTVFFLQHLSLLGGEGSVEDAGS